MNFADTNCVHSLFLCEIPRYKILYPKQNKEPRGWSSNEKKAEILWTSAIYSCLKSYIPHCKICTTSLFQAIEK
jgi:hypothetical protein